MTSPPATTVTDPPPAMVWRMRLYRPEPGYHGPRGVAVWVAPEGPQLLEFYREEWDERPVLKIVPHPSLRAAIDAFEDLIPHWEIWCGYWFTTPPAPDMSIDDIAEHLFTKPDDTPFQPDSTIDAMKKHLTTPTPATPSPNPEAIALPGGRSYWPRPMAELTDVDVLRRARGTLYTRIKGLPANGKTMLAEAAFGDDLIVVQGHGDLCVDDLIGRYLPNLDTDGYTWHDGPLVRAMREGKVLLFDEITRAPSDTVSALLSATDDRRILVLDGRPDLPVIHAADGFHVIVTYNETGIGVRPLDPAVIRRFPLEIEVTIDLTLVAALGVDQRLIDTATRLRTLHHHAISQGDIGLWTPQTGHLLNAQRALELLGDTAAAGVLLAACTEPQDRTTVADVLAEIFAIDTPTLTQKDLT